MNDIDKTSFMRIAIEEAKAAFEKGEIPVGAVIVREGKIIARGHNRNRELNDPVKHAEIICIEEAARIIGLERLTDCDLFVSKEPCAMCAGAIVHARIRKLYIATEDQKYGACGTVLSVCGNHILNHIPEIEFGLLREESSFLLKDFFRDIREGKQ